MTCANFWTYSPHLGLILSVVFTQPPLLPPLSAGKRCKCKVPCHSFRQRNFGRPPPLPHFASPGLGIPIARLREFNTHDTIYAILLPLVEILRT